MKASSRRASRRKRLLRLVVVVVILLVLWQLVPRTLGYIASLVMSPVTSFEHWLSESTDRFPSYVRDRASLLEERDSLAQQLAELRSAEQSINFYRTENIALRALLGASTTPRIAATVLAQPTRVPYDALVIDKGSKDGIIEKAPVYAGYEQIIGFVEAFYPTSALVVLVTTPGVESTVYVVGPDIYTTAVGQGGGALQIGVPQGILLSAGDPVILPSLDGGIYGEIVSVDSSPTRPEQFGYVTITEPIQNIRWVSVGAEARAPLSFEEAKAIVDATKAEITAVPVPEGVLVEIPEISTTTATSSSEQATSTPET